MNLRVMSFNIRNSDANDGINKWVNRKSSVQEIIKSYNPDIVGFQEVLPDQMRDLRTMLPHYSGIEAGRDNGTNLGEGVPIFYQKEKFEIKSIEKFWMSNSPTTPHNHWGNLPRITVIVKFHPLISSGKEFFVGNTHFDHLNESIRVKSAALLLKKIDPIITDPVIIMGDFNAWPHFPAYKKMVTKLRDVFIIPPNHRARNAITFHNFSGRTSKKIVHLNLAWLDYFFVNTEINIGQAQVITDIPYSPVFPSDHWPIMCEFEF